MKEMKEIGGIQGVKREIMNMGWKLTKRHRQAGNRHQGRMARKRAKEEREEKEREAHLSFMGKGRWGEIKKLPIGWMIRGEKKPRRMEMPYTERQQMKTGTPVCKNLNCKDGRSLSPGCRYWGLNQGGGGLERSLQGCRESVGITFDQMALCLPCLGAIRPFLEDFPRLMFVSFKSEHQLNSEVLLEGIRSFAVLQKGAFKPMFQCDCFLPQQDVMDLIEELDLSTFSYFTMRLRETAGSSVMQKIQPEISRIEPSRGQTMEEFIDWRSEVTCRERVWAVIESGINAPQAVVIDFTGDSSEGDE